MKGQSNRKRLVRNSVRTLGTEHRVQGLMSEDNQDFGFPVSARSQIIPRSDQYDRGTNIRPAFDGLPIIEQHAAEDAAFKFDPLMDSDRSLAVIDMDSQEHCTSSFPLTVQFMSRRLDRNLLVREPLLEEPYPCQAAHPITSEPKGLPRSLEARGRKRALLVGINYRQTKGARKLSSCVNDAICIRQLLVEQFGFEVDNMWIMTDEPVNLPKGHGSQVPDVDGDELDAFDETILPADFPVSGHIVDDEIHDIMVRGLCRGARLTTLFDCCNSATIMDLPFVHSPEGSAEGMVSGTAETRIRTDTARSGANDNYSRLAKAVVQKFVNNLLKRKPPSAAVQFATTMQKEVSERIRHCGVVVSFSACSDHQKSADVSGQAGCIANGAMTHAFVEALAAAPATPRAELNLQSLLNSMDIILKSLGHSQIPHLSLSHDLSLLTPFML